MRTKLLVLVLLPVCFTYVSFSQDQTWKSGVAARVITPKQSLWMAGYASRKQPADSSLHDLWVKALVLEDSRGNQAVFISSDLLGLPRNISEKVTDKLISELGLKRSQIMLSSSHTHSGPVLSESLVSIYPLSAEQIAEINIYSDWLVEQIVEVVKEAASQLVPTFISSGQGQTRFAVNRRNNKEEEINVTSEFKGPVDHSVPVLAIRNQDQSLKAVVFGYACHATTLNSNYWSGDYPGFAQSYLEQQLPGATALFFAGCGGDQNPLPRRSIALAKQYGGTLAVAVLRALQDEMSSLDPILFSEYAEIELDYSSPLNRDELVALQNSDVDYYKTWAEYWLKHRDAGKPMPVKYPYYPIQTWQLGSQSWIALGGEVVVDYSIRTKKMFGPGLFITAYANDVMAYIPSLRVLKEGGYEGDTSMRAYGLPSTWSESIEEEIIAEIKVQLESIQSKLTK